MASLPPQYVLPNADAGATSLLHSFQPSPYTEEYAAQTKTTVTEEQCRAKSSGDLAWRTAEVRFLGDLSPQSASSMRHIFKHAELRKTVDEHVSRRSAFR